MIKKGLYLCLLLMLLLGLATSLHPVRAAETDCGLRDPSTIVRDHGLYWIYGTGRGIPEYSSSDRLHWTFRGEVFSSAPAWVASTVPASTSNFAWAPDIRFFHGKWHLYYSFSSFGSNISGIGVATNDTLSPRSWTDQGLVVQSGKNTNYNAIDPAVFQGPNGELWLSFGSFFSGIKLVQLDTATGKQRAGLSNIYTLAEHPQSPANAIEASMVTYHAGFYYLFVNWDSCCRGNQSTYNIRVGRSKNITGPYRDRAGLKMLQGGGTLFLGAVKSSAAGAVTEEVGPGHAGVLSERGGEFFSCSYEWARDRAGKSTVNVSKLTWDRDGWPQISE